jgi:hypothetical protein
MTPEYEKKIEWSLVTEKARLGDLRNMTKGM